VKASILVVDDKPDMCTYIQKYLAWIGYGVEVAVTLSGARARLSATTFDLVITDLRLDEGSGIDLLAEIRARTPATRTILMSAHADAQSAATAIEQGIDYLLLKPFAPADLQTRVEDALARRVAQDAAETERRVLAKLVLEQAEKTERWMRGAVHALTSAVEAKDKYTAGHAGRVTAYAMALARAVGGIDLDRFRLACDLHDVGKIGVPDSVLNRPARLTPEEYEMVAAHPDTGERILRPLIDDPLVLGTVRWHHERWDGHGYPDGRAGREIPLTARVLAVADTLDAMTSHRAYRNRQPWSAAVAEILRCAGSQFDPDVVGVFERIVAELEAIFLGFEPGDDVPA
jgi:response regulator RpfG family c-di-GMP phosphodiesterase